MRSNHLTAFFSHAGGNSASWSGLLSYWNDHHTVFVERPGRGTRRSDNVPKDLRELVLDQASIVAERCSGKGITLIGHSFGGGLAWLVAHELKASGHNVQRIVISAAPPVNDDYRNPTEVLDDESLLDSLVRAGGMSPVLKHNKAMRQIILHQLKHDYRWKSQFRNHANGILRIPSVVVTPLGDSFLSVETSQKWKRLIECPQFVTVSGGHFAPLTEKMLIPSNIEKWFSNGN